MNILNVVYSTIEIIFLKVFSLYFYLNTGRRLWNQSVSRCFVIILLICFIWLFLSIVYIWCFVIILLTYKIANIRVKFVHKPLWAFLVTAQLEINHVSAREPTNRNKSAVETINHVIKPYVNLPYQHEPRIRSGGNMMIVDLSAPETSLSNIYQDNDIQWWYFCTVKIVLVLADSSLCHKFPIFSGIFSV